MSNDINLLYSKKQGQLGKLTRKVKLLRLIALSILSLVAIASVIIFILVLASPLPSLKEEEAALAAQLNSENAKITKYTLLVKRLTEANTIIKNRSQYDTTLTTFEKELPQEVRLIGFRAEQNVINLRLASGALDQLQLYMETLSKLTEDDIATSVTMGSMSTNESEGFTADITVVLR